MKKLCIVMLALVGLSTGCVVETVSGGFDVAWFVTLDGQASDCATVGAAGVAITITDHFDGSGESYEVPCTDGRFIVDGYADGNYTVVVQAVDASGNTLSDAVPVDVSIVGGSLVQLTFDLAFTGGQVFPSDVVFDVDYGNPGGSNCDSTANGGSGVVQMQVFLTPIGGTYDQCIQYSFTSANTSGGHTCGGVTVCEDAGVAVTIPQVEAGSYTLTVIGLKGATSATPVACYGGALDVTIGGDGNPVDLQTIVVPFDENLGGDPAACNATKPL